MPEKKNVQEMFNGISRHYDFLNHFLSLGIDRIWRKETALIIAKTNPKSILDVATGTADLAIALAAHTKADITGIDISTKMLKIGEQKIKDKNLQNRIQLSEEDSEQLPYSENSFDAVTIAFGIRNFHEPEKGLREMARVLKTLGTVAILEFSKPTKFPIKQLFGFYFNRILPIFGRWISKEPSAYTYLPESVSNFPYGDDFANIMQSAGFTKVKQKPLSFGIATIYYAEKA
jgi:ubiquinone/menaquinone biosynthesis methyltransferases